MQTDPYSQKRGARLDEIDVILADPTAAYALSSTERLLLLYEAMGLCQAQGDEQRRERYQVPAALLVGERTAAARAEQGQLTPRGGKPSPTQVAILAAMADGRLSLQAHQAEGNVEPFYPRRMVSAFPQTTPRILVATLDALRALGMIEEEKRWVSGTPSQGEYRWIDWTVSYQLTERARTFLAGRQAGGAPMSQESSACRAAQETFWTESPGRKEEW